MKKLTACLLLLLAGAAWAQKDKPVITPPPPPEELTQGETLEPQVSIVQRDWGTIEEYSVNGQVYAVKITPAVGLPYYFYDSDGDGTFDMRHAAEQGIEMPEINRWKIFSW